MMFLGQTGLLILLLLGPQIAAMMLKETAAKSAKSAEDVIEEFGGVKGLCDYWGFQPLPANTPKPRIFYAVVAGNNGQDDVYEAHFLEISPFVSRIVAVDPQMTFLGFSRNQSLNMSSPAFARFGEQLVRVVVEHPFPGKALRGRNGYEEMTQEQKDFFKRPRGTSKVEDTWLIEEWTRAQMDRGFKNPEGKWVTNEDDIVIVADSDEIPLPSVLTAIQYCEVPLFAQAKRRMAAGEDAHLACQPAKLALTAQVYEYFIDCPVTRPIWWHPDAMPAACVMSGAFDFQDVRTGGVSTMTDKIASRHLHNLGMPPEEIAFKYASYAEPRNLGWDSGLDVETNQEMMWRACDPNAPDVGPEHWYMHVRPSNDFLRTDNRRGYSKPAEKRRGIDEPLAILKEGPELAKKLIWSGHAEKRNPFVGKQGGTYFFDH